MWRWIIYHRRSILELKKRYFKCSLCSFPCKHLFKLKLWSIPDTGYIALEEYTAVAKMIWTLVFSAAKSGFKSVIYIFCCSVSIGNISLHFQTLIFPLIVIIQWDLCLHKESDTQRSDLIIIKKQRQTKSRRTVAKKSRNLLQNTSVILATTESGHFYCAFVLCFGHFAFISCKETMWTYW